MRAKELTGLINDRPGNRFKLTTAVGFAAAAVIVAGRRAFARKSDAGTGSNLAIPAASRSEVLDKVRDLAEDLTSGLALASGRASSLASDLMLASDLNFGDRIALDSALDCANLLDCELANIRELALDSANILALDSGLACLFDRANLLASDLALARDRARDVTAGRDLAEDLASGLAFASDLDSVLDSARALHRDLANLLDSAGAPARSRRAAGSSSPSGPASSSIHSR